MTYDYIEETAEGVIVHLNKGIDIAGAKVMALTMREPTVADQLATDAMKGTDGVKEVTQFANLCMVTPDDIKKLTLADYKRVQNAFLSFAGND